MPEQEPIKALVVDDDPVVRRMLCAWIQEDLKAKLTEARDGMDALDIVRGGAVELLLLDINMPLLDGLEALRQLREERSIDRVEVLMVSGVTDVERVRQAVRLGASDYLVKPLQFYESVRRLRLAAERIHERRAEAARKTVLDKPRLLVAHPDLEFRKAAQSALSRDYSLRSADDAAQVILQILRWKPAAILLSPKLSGLDLEELFARAKSLPGSEAPQLFRLDEPTAEGPSGAKEPLGKEFAGSLPRILEGDELCQAVKCLISGEPIPKFSSLDSQKSEAKGEENSAPEREPDGAAAAASSPEEAPPDEKPLDGPTNTKPEPATAQTVNG